MKTDTFIPRRLDDAWKLGFWDIDVAAPFLFSFLLAYLSGRKLSAAVCMLAGWLASRWLSRIKADKHPAFALHWLYWHLPASPLTALRCAPPSHQRRLVG